MFFVYELTIIIPKDKKIRIEEMLLIVLNLYNPVFCQINANQKVFLSGF